MSILRRLADAFSFADAAIKYSMHDAPVSGSSKYIIPGPGVWRGGGGGTSAAKGKAKGAYVDSEVRNVTDNGFD